MFNDYSELISGKSSKMVETIEGLQYSQLQKECENIKHKINSHTNCDEISHMVRQFISETKQRNIGDQFICDNKLNQSIECYILGNLHDTIASNYYKSFRDEDDLIFQKCLSLQHVRVSHAYGDINLPASIVELASLDVHKSAHDKLACLTACYDFIFAEIKFAIVELIAAETTAEVAQIPIVNNADIIPVLVEVILKAKCKHLYSNLYFVQSLSDNHVSDKDSAHVLSCFNDAVESLMEINQEKVGTFRKACSEMDLKQLDKMARRLNDSSISNSFERLSMARLSRQISKSQEYIGSF